MSEHDNTVNNNITILEIITVLKTFMKLKQKNTHHIST